MAGSRRTNPGRLYPEQSLPPEPNQPDTSPIAGWAYAPPALAMGRIVMDRPAWVPSRRNAFRRLQRRPLTRMRGNVAISIAGRLIAKGPDRASRRRLRWMRFPGIPGVQCATMITTSWSSLAIRCMSPAGCSIMHLAYFSARPALDWRPGLWAGWTEAGDRPPRGAPCCSGAGGISARQPVGSSRK